MVLFLTKMESSADAVAAQEEAAGGSLWGVSLGTTSTAVVVGSILVVRCTDTRARSLGAEAGFSQRSAIESVDDMSFDRAALYGLGKMDGA